MAFCGGRAGGEHSGSGCVGCTRARREFAGQLRGRHREQIVVLIPVALPDRLRYRFLHNHYDLVLTAALRNRPGVVTARVPMRLHLPPASGHQSDT